MTSYFTNQMFPYLYAMTSFISEDILVIGYDDKLKVIDSQYIGENNTICTAGFNKEKLAQIMNDKKYKYLLIAHNHPNTTAEPSNDDIEFTKHICGLCEVMNITFLDHIIVSKNLENSFSFKKSPLLKIYLTSLQEEDISIKYNLIIKTVIIIKIYTKQQIFKYEKQPIKDKGYNMRIRKLKNIRLMSSYILKNYSFNTSFKGNFYQTNEQTLEEVRYIFNKGDFLNEKEFSKFKYYKWLQSDEGQKAVYTINLYKIIVYILCLLGPIFLPAFFPSKTGSFLENLFSFFAISAFASPVLLPIEILVASFLTKILDNEFYTTIEQRFNIKIDHSSEKSDIAAVGLAMKTHYSLSNEWKKGDWIEK